MKTIKTKESKSQWQLFSSPLFPAFQLRLGLFSLCLYRCLEQPYMLSLGMCSQPPHHGEESTFKPLGWLVNTSQVHVLTPLVGVAETNLFLHWIQCHTTLPPVFSQQIIWLAPRLLPPRFQHHLRHMTCDTPESWEGDAAVPDLGTKFSHQVTPLGGTKGCIDIWQF